jgi:hypothetical protein
LRRSDGPARHRQGSPLLGGHFIYDATTAALAVADITALRHPIQVTAGVSRHSGGGTSNNGVAYEISSSGTFSVIHNFCPDNCVHSIDGVNPNALAIDAAGNLYGTTSYGGNLNCTDGNGSGCGTVFELSRSDGRWREKILHSFGYRDGITPLAGPALATIKIGKKMQNVIFGVTYLGSGNTGGNVFEMVKSKSAYTFRVIHRFRGAEGCCSTHALTIARSSLYGTASLGGSGGGTVFKLAQKEKYWTDTVLYSFTGGSDGKYPISGGGPIEISARVEDHASPR